MKFLFFLALALVVSPTYGDDLLIPSGATQPQVTNFVWNRYTTGNFVILSIDDSQGQWLSENIDQMKIECLTRWGFPDVSLSKECRIFCVPTRSQLKKLFDIDQSKVEIRSDISVMWLVLDDKPPKVINPYLSLVALSEFEIKYKVKIAFWFKRSSFYLNLSPAEIKQNLSKLGVLLKKDKEIYISEKIFTMTESDFDKNTSENKLIFDQQALALCLLLRQEFGQVKMQGFLRMSFKNDPQDVLKLIYGFNGYKHFDKQYLQYMKDLTFDISKEKTPDSYLLIKPVL